MAPATTNQYGIQCTGEQSHVAFRTLQVQRHSHCSERPLWFPLDSTQGTHHGQEVYHRSGHHHQRLVPLVAAESSAWPHLTQLATSLANAATVTSSPSSTLLATTKPSGLFRMPLLAVLWGAATWLWMHVAVTLCLILLPPHASDPVCCPQCLHAYATNCARIFSLLRVCLYKPAVRSPPPLLCPTCSAPAAYTFSKLVTAPIRPLAGCKRAPLEIRNTSAFALRCGTLAGCWRNRPAFRRLRNLTCLLLLPCPLLAGTLSSCSATLEPSLSRSQDTSSHFGCPRKMFAHSCMIYTTMQSRLLMQ